PTTGREDSPFKAGRAGARAGPSPPPGARGRPAGRIVRSAKEGVRAVSLDPWPRSWAWGGGFSGDKEGRLMPVELQKEKNCLDGAAGEASDSAEMLSQRGAMKLARRLERYWHERGYPAARFWAEPVDERFSKIGTYEVYCVASNLVNGLPPRYRDE